MPMKTYRNIKNGAIIEISSELNSSLWVEVKPQPKAVEKPVEVVEEVKTEAPKKTTKRKKVD